MARRLRAALRAEGLPENLRGMIEEYLRDRTGNVNSGTVRQTRRKAMYEVQVRNEMGWTNDIAGCPNGTVCETIAEVDEAMAHLKRLWPEAEFRVTEIQ